MLLVFSVDRTRFIAHRACSCSNQKEKPVVISLVATSDQGSAFGNRKLFEKSLSKNFARGKVFTQAFPSFKFFGATLSFKKGGKISFP
jgi:hypothetical protein